MTRRGNEITGIITKAVVAEFIAKYAGEIFSILTILLVELLLIDNKTIGISVGMCLAFIVFLFRSYKDDTGKEIEKIRNGFYWHGLCERFITIKKIVDPQYQGEIDKLFKMFDTGLSDFEKNNIPIYKRKEYVEEIIRFLNDLSEDDANHLVYLAILNFRSWRATAWTKEKQEDIEELKDLFDDLLNSKIRAKAKGVKIVSLFLLDRHDIKDKRISKIISLHGDVGEILVCGRHSPKGFSINQCAIMAKLINPMSMSEVISKKDNHKELKLQIEHVDIAKSLVFLEEPPYSENPYAGKILRNKEEIERYFVKFHNTLTDCEGMVNKPPSEDGGGISLCEITVA